MMDDIILWLDTLAPGTDIQELAEQAMKDADAFYQRLSSRIEYS
ncbi:hypothetical protein [uncultured Bifidobacterium sp.]|nr:hypothetical protein [uncultured Bifidobacterium sp.]